uniref:Uncharacterized protein n=1 Tax=Lotharella globosa TaxID=91324 RepID=A0A7S4E0U7_9EUKA|mmetsp:Transcript_3536/g.7068  ORF Transcript_3536/g.7068 Transcript_3536/m.7068 type:complete len:213 (-) Transcript_3536:181-819(-)
MPLGRFSAFARRYTAIAGGLTLGGRYLVGDTFTQMVIERVDRKDYSPRRSVCFMVFGSIMGAGPMTWWFARFLPTCYTSLPRWPAIVARSLTDCWTLMPFFYFPIFYQVKEAVHWDGVMPMQKIPVVAWEKYKTGFFSDLKSTTQVCFPMNMILFSSVPDHVRVPAMSVLGFVWVLSLSMRRGKQQTLEEIDGAKHATGELIAAGGASSDSS